MALFMVPRLEDGTSAVSIKNAEYLVKTYGLPDRILLRVSGPSDRDYTVDAWCGKNYHDFRGFSWGFKGTGPRALERFFALIRLPIDLNVIAKLRPEDMRYKASVLEWEPAYPFEFRKGIHYS